MAQKLTHEQAIELLKEQLLIEYRAEVEDLREYLQKSELPAEDLDGERSALAGWEAEIADVEATTYTDAETIITLLEEQGYEREEITNIVLYALVQMPTVEEILRSQGKI